MPAATQRLIPVVRNALTAYEAAVCDAAIECYTMTIDEIADGCEGSAGYCAIGSLLSSLHAESAVVVIYTVIVRCVVDADDWDCLQSLCQYLWNCVDHGGPVERWEELSMSLAMFQRDYC